MTKHEYSKGYRNDFLAFVAHTKGNFYKKIDIDYVVPARVEPIFYSGKFTPVNMGLVLNHFLEGLEYPII